MRKLKITVLSDNVAGKWCRAEHGFSFLVEADRKLLFDTGSSDLIVHNAEILDIDLAQTGTIVLSHGHEDHTGGLMNFEGQQLVCHPDAFIARFRKTNGSPLGIRWTEGEIRSRFDLQGSKDPVQLSEQIFFLGEIPRITEFESQKTAFIKADGTDDFVSDDSGLAVISDKGLVVISGCAHSGICNMTAHAVHVTGIAKVHAVIGGFHLQNDDSVTRQTLDWLKMMQVDQVIPSHCTGFAAQAAIFSEYSFIQVKTGNIIEIG